MIARVHDRRTANHRLQGLGKTITALALILKTRGLEPALPGEEVSRRRNGSGREVAFYTGGHDAGRTLGAVCIRSAMLPPTPQSLRNCFREIQRCRQASFTGRDLRGICSACTRAIVCEHRSAKPR